MNLDWRFCRLHCQLHWLLLLTPLTSLVDTAFVGHLGAGNLLNVILHPILIFVFGFGISGAAIATVISEYLIDFILLWKLNGEVQLVSPKIDGEELLDIYNLFVAGSQPINALAFVQEGLSYGVSDFGYVAYSMVRHKKRTLEICMV